MSENKQRAMHKQRESTHNGPPGSAIGRPVEKAKDFGGTVRRILRYLNSQIPKLVIVLIFAVISTYFTIRAPKIMGDATNQLTDGFIAKSTVNSVSSLQKKTIPTLKDQLKKINDAESAAVEQTNAKIKEQFDAKVSQQKQQAYQQAVQQVDAALSQKLGGAVNSPAFAQAKQQAEAQAKAAVDTQFAKQQSTLDSQLKSAEDNADKTVRDTVESQILQKANLDSAKYSALKELAGMPNVKTIKDNHQKADNIQKFISLSEKLSNKKAAVSKTDLDKGISDVRKYGGEIPLDAIAKTLLFLLLVYILSSLFQFVMQYIMSGVAQYTVYAMRKDIDEKIARMPLRYFDSHPIGDTLSRMTNDIDTISTTLQQSLTQLITSVLQLVGYVWMMLTISWKLTLIVLATLPLYIITTILIAKHSQKYYAAQQKHLGELSGHTEEMFTGHTVVKAFGHEKESIQTFQAINDDLYNVGWKAQFLSGVMMPVMNFIGNLGYVLIAVIGGIFVTKNNMGLGSIVSFISYSKSFSMPIIQTANIANIIQSTVACAERVFNLLDEEEEIPDADNAITIDNPNGNIVFDHVAFSYSEDKPLIEEMNLDIKQGDTIAIVGPTGAGKTTLVNLLMRFYEINGGEIAFDGNDIRNIRRGDLRKMFGMVLQDTWLFNGTIHDNIAYGREGATEDEIVNAAKAAHADHFIRSLPDGYNTILNEEASNISQGQKQLLTIARALLADPVVLILDEATSSVDTRTELLIQKAMGKLMEGRTNFVIAHRLSTIRDAKMILVMNHGTIIENGNHKELLEKGGFYADLYNSQFTGKSIDEAE